MWKNQWGMSELIRKYSFGWSLQLHCSGSRAHTTHHVLLSSILLYKVCPIACDLIWKALAAWYSGAPKNCTCHMNTCHHPLNFTYATAVLWSVLKNMSKSPRRGLLSILCFGRKHMTLTISCDSCQNENPYLWGGGLHWGMWDRVSWTQMCYVWQVLPLILPQGNLAWEQTRLCLSMYINDDLYVPVTRWYTHLNFHPYWLISLTGIAQHIRILQHNSKIALFNTKISIHPIIKSYSSGCNTPSACSAVSLAATFAPVPSDPAQQQYHVKPFNSKYTSGKSSSFRFVSWLHTEIFLAARWSGLTLIVPDTWCAFVALQVQRGETEQERNRIYIVWSSMCAHNLSWNIVYCNDLSFSLQSKQFTISRSGKWFSIVWCIGVWQVSNLNLVCITYMGVTHSGDNAAAVDYFHCFSDPLSVRLLSVSLVMRIEHTIIPVCILKLTFGFCEKSSKSYKELERAPRRFKVLYTYM